jgi:hypothetical protein
MIEGARAANQFRIFCQPVVEGDVRVRLWFVRNAFQCVGDFRRDLGFLFVAEWAGDADIDVGAWLFAQCEILQAKTIFGRPTRI